MNKKAYRKENITLKEITLRFTGGRSTLSKLNKPNYREMKVKLLRGYLCSTGFIGALRLNLFVDPKSDF